MSKKILSALAMGVLAPAALVILSVSMAPVLADNNNSGVCSGKKVVGSFIRVNPGNKYMDQLILTGDGIAYWYQSTAFDFLVTGGTYIPEIGSWACQTDGTVLVTTISTQYQPQSGDEVKDKNTRFTQKLIVVDEDTLAVSARFTREFALTDDPLGNNGTVQGGCTSCPPYTYKRIKPVPTDVP